MVDKSIENSAFNKCFLKFKDGLGKNDFKQFKSYKNCYEWLKWVKIRSETNEFPQRLEKGKDEVEAINTKNKGNEEYQKGNKEEALNLYNASVALFPVDGKKSEYAIIRANRSAVLYQLNEYELAIKDIDHALAIGYPEELRHKVLDRKAKCLLALKQNNSAISVFRETITALDNAKLSEERRQKWQRDIQIMLAIMIKNKVIDEKQAANTSKYKMKGERNEIYSSASNMVNINYNEKVGRFAEAAVDIPCGEILINEKAYCSVLLNENVKTHCFQCFKRVIAGEPCPNCISIKFCSDKCKKVALATHHKYECQILESLWYSGVSITCLMSLRIISQSSVNFFLKIKHKLKEQIGKWTEKEYNCADFLTVYQLVRHEEKRTVNDLLQRAYVSLFLLMCLKQANYFSSIANNEEREEAEILIGGIMMRFLQILQFNAHEISELEVKGKNLNDWKSSFLGGGLYPTLALFNHSCEPSLVRYFNGTKVTARAVKRIKAGEVIAENYGPIFTIKPRKERQQVLIQQYWFECCCIPCVNNWPMLDYMDPNSLRFHCDNKSCNNILIVGTDNMDMSVDCRVCGRQTNIMRGLKALQDSESLFRLGESLMQTGEIEKALTKFLELYDLLMDNLVPPFRDYYLCQQRIRSCLLTFGNMSSSLVSLKKTASQHQ